MIEKTYRCEKCKKVCHVQFNPAPEYPNSMLLLCLKDLKAARPARCEFRECALQPKRSKKT